MATYIHPFHPSNQHHSGSGYNAHISYENVHFQHPAHRIPVSPAAHEPQPYPITHGIPIYPAYLPPPHASSSLTTTSEPPTASAAPAQPSSSSSSSDTSSRTTKHAGPSRSSTPAIPLPPTARRSSNDAPSAMAPLRDMPSPIIPISASSSPASSPTSSPTSSPERVKRDPAKSAHHATVRNPPRGVHFTEDLVCPTPPPHAPRRKGFFNRRGDQLWTNAGGYKPADPSDLYPPDLDSYPEPGEGWENEDGVRIDMKHRRMPGASIRPVLKKTPPR